MKVASLYKKSYIILISIMILIPPFFTDFGHDRVSELDNRMLVEFDEIEGKTIFEKIDVYLADRIGFRDNLLTVNEIVTDKVFHKLIHPFYIYGKNGEIFTEWDLITFQHKDVAQEYVENFAGYMKSLKEFCGSYDCDFIHIMVPSKESIYPELYANGYEISDRKSRAEKINDELKKNNINNIYLKDIFDRTRDESRLYNKYYDVGHWNANGIYCCMEELTGFLHKRYPGVKTINRGDFVISEMKHEYLPLSRQRKEEMIPVYTPEVEPLKSDGEDFFNKEVRCIHGDGRYRFHAIRKDAEELPKILVFNDSFFEESDANKYFLNQYSELTMIHVMNLPDIEYYVSSLKPDIVILESCERSYESEGVYDFEHLKKRFRISGVNEDEFETRQVNTGLTITEISSSGGNMPEYISVAGKAGDMPVPDMIMMSVKGKKYYACKNSDYYDGEFVFSIKKEEAMISDIEGKLTVDFIYKK